MARQNYILLLLLTVLLFSCEKKPVDPVTTGTIAGKVTDFQNGNALNGANISTIPITSTIQTGSDGNFKLSDLNPGQYTVNVKKENYNDNSVIVNVIVGQETRADIALKQKQPELGISTNSLGFETALTQKILAITNKGIGEVDWTIENNLKWLQVSPTTGSTTTETDNVTFTVNRTGLNPGDYTGIVMIRSNGGDLPVSILMTVVNPNAPMLTVSVGVLNFLETLSDMSFSIANSGTGDLNWTIITTQTWIKFAPASGKNNSIVAVSVQRQNLPAADYTGKITVNSNGGSSDINVLMKVAQGGSPNPVTLGDPTNITATSMTLAWTRNSDDSFDAYILYRSTSATVDDNSTQITVITDRETRQYNDQNLSPNTTYYYRLYVRNKTSQKAGSNIVTGKSKMQLGSWGVQGTVDQKLKNIWMLNSNFGYAVATSFFYFWNGKSWLKQTIDIGGLSNPYFYSTYGINDHDIYVCEYNGLWHYDGINWQKSTESFSTLAGGIFMLSTNDIWIAPGGNGSILYHYDGKKIIQTFSITGAYSLCFINSTNGMLISSGDIYKWNGSTWVKTLEGKGIGGISYAKDGYAIAVNHFTNEIWEYKNDSWQKFNKTVPIIYETVLSLNKNYSIIAGETGKVYYFDGTDLTEWNTGGYYIDKFFALSENDIWAISGGTILRYTK